MPSFIQAYYQQLVGKRIASIEIQSEEPWLPETPVLVFDDGFCAFVMCDEEGNGPGHLDMYRSDQAPMLPAPGTYDQRTGG